MEIGPTVISEKILFYMKYLTGTTTTHHCSSIIVDNAGTYLEKNDFVFCKIL